MAGRSGAPTIADVAAHAGVSPATVSRVMNGRFVGDPEVAERVVAAAKALAYSPSHLARSLALGRTRAVGFVVPDLANPAFQAMLSSLSKAAARDRYRVLVADSAETPDDEPALVSEVRGRCDAIVLCAPRMSDAELVPLVESLQPLVLINRVNPSIAAPTLSIDYASGIRTIVRRLYELGHRRVLYLEGPSGSASHRDRLAGLAAVESELDGLRVERMPGGATSESGASAGEAVAASEATAIVAYNDLVAIGLMTRLQELGVRVPDDKSVTGFDDIPFARYTAPALTSASVPHTELGAQAWRRMAAVLAGASPEHDIVFQPRLEVRDSTAAPRS